MTNKDKLYQDAIQKMSHQPLEDVTRMILDPLAETCSRLAAMNVVMSSSKKSDEEKIGLLLECLQSSTPPIAGLAITNLGRLKHEKAREVLHDALTKPDFQILALEALRNHDESLFYEECRALMCHPNVQCRKNVLVALGAIVTDGSALVIQRALQEDASVEIQMLAAHLMLCRRLPLGENLLVRLLNVPISSADVVSKSCWLSVAKALGDLGNEAALNRLKKMLVERSDWDNDLRFLRVLLNESIPIEPGQSFDEWRHLALSWCDNKQLG